MSDPVTNVAIEDVLSSIRRLVSEDARVRPLGLRAEPEAPDGPAGKLVLTPALRVSAPAADDAPEQDDAPPRVGNEIMQSLPHTRFVKWLSAVISSVSSLPDSLPEPAPCCIRGHAIRHWTRETLPSPPQREPISPAHLLEQAVTHAHVRRGGQHR